jgi:preprotein translocase subunit SecG
LCVVVVIIIIVVVVIIIIIMEPEVQLNSQLHFHARADCIFSQSIRMLG